MDDDAAIAMAAKSMGLETEGDETGIAAEKGKGKGTGKGKGAEATEEKDTGGSSGEGEGKKEGGADDEEEDWELPETFPSNSYNKGVVANLKEVLFPRSMAYGDIGGAKGGTGGNDKSVEGLLAEREKLKAKMAKKQGQKSKKQKKN